MPPIYLSVAEHPDCVDKADVYLDGGEIPAPYVLAAHEGEGWVEQYWMDDRGHPIVTLPPHRRAGRVEIRPKPGVTREELERIADANRKWDGMRDWEITIGPLWLHRREQWDLDCRPWLCVHWRRPGRTMRLLCVWRWGLDLGPLLVSRRGVRYTRQFWRLIRK